MRLLLFTLFIVFLSAYTSVYAQENSAAETTNQVYSAKSWLTRLSEVISESNYEVSYVLYRVGHETVPYLLRHGVLEDGTVMEQLNLQNGPGREVIRVNQQVSVFEPDAPPYSMRSDLINGPIPGALLHNPDSLYDAYEFVAVGRSRISGQPAQQIRIVSRDDTRFSYQLWLDETTAMLLKLNMIDKQGNILEQIQVTSFAFAETAHPYFSRINQEMLPRIMAMPPTRPGKHQWNIGYVPMGMEEIKQDTRRLSISGQIVDYRLFSDGLVDISVYVEPAGESFNQDLMLRHNLNAFLSIKNGGYQVTVVGQIPPETANNIARSLVLE